MSLIDRINQRILARLRPNRAQPSLVDDAMRVGREIFPLRELVGVIVFEADIYAGTVITISLAFSNRKTLNVTQEDKCWGDLLGALDRLNMTTMPSREWLAAMAAGEGKIKPIVLLDRRIPIA